MTKGETLTILAGTAEDELGDSLLELGAAWWLEQGYSREDVLELMAEALKDSGEASE